MPLFCLKSFSLNFAFFYLFLTFLSYILNREDNSRHKIWKKFFNFHSVEKHWTLNWTGWTLKGVPFNSVHTTLNKIRVQSWKIRFMVDIVRGAQEWDRCATTRNFFIVHEWWGIEWLRINEGGEVELYISLKFVN